MKIKLQLASAEIPHFKFFKTYDMLVTLLIRVTVSEK